MTSLVRALSLVAVTFSLFACSVSAGPSTDETETTGQSTEALTSTGFYFGGTGRGTTTDFKCSNGVCICSIGSDCSRDLPNSGKCKGEIVCGDFECACASTK